MYSYEISKSFDNINSKAAVDLFRQSFCEEKNEKWAAEDIFSFLNNGSPNKIYAIARYESTLVGFASSFKLMEGQLPPDINVEDAYYNDVDVVHSSSRGLGLGRELLKARIKFLSDNKLAKRLIVRFRDDNRAVKSLYQNFGFSVVHEYDLEYHGITTKRLIAEATIAELINRID